MFANNCFLPFINKKNFVSINAIFIMKYFYSHFFMKYFYNLESIKKIKVIQIIFLFESFNICIWRTSSKKLTFPQGQVVTASTALSHGLQGPSWQICWQEWCSQERSLPQVEPHENDFLLAVSLLHSLLLFSFWQKHSRDKI